MGSFSPVADLPPGIVQHTLDRVIKPVLKTMANDGKPYTGFLYAGLVLTDNEPTVLEFNCRLGDPETQVLMPRMASDLIDLIEAWTRWSAWSPRNGMTLPVSTWFSPPRAIPRHRWRGRGVEIGDLPDGALIFHAGTGEDENGLFAQGGRVLNVVGTGSALAEARANAYAAVERDRVPRRAVSTGYLGWLT